MKWQISSRISALLGVLLASTVTFLGVMSAEPSGSPQVFLPIVFAPPPPPEFRVNAPFFGAEVIPNESAIFWFGQVYLTENYTDVRVGYTNEALYVRLAVFDRQVWYDTSPAIQDLTEWDSATLYLNLTGDNGNLINSNSYAFVGQLAPGEPNIEAAYQGTGGQWQQISIPFTSSATYHTIGNGLNNDAVQDYGWTLSYYIPFASLGISGTPSPNTLWGMAINLYDRDDIAGIIQIEDKMWPPNMVSIVPETWGQLSYGLTPSSLSGVQANREPDATTLIRHGLNGAVVKDGMVGGGFNCGTGLSPIYANWGIENYLGAHQINIQNQYNLGDWPCFSKYYVTFPLESIPSNAQITSATLTMMHFSNSGGDDNPVDSLLQVLTVGEDWEEGTLAWNNSPLATENVSQLWVPSYYGNPPPIARIWDVSSAVAEALNTGNLLRLVIYSADSAQHSGKYFISSDAGPASATDRPTLTVNWVNP